MTAEDITGHEFGGRHILQRMFRENLTRHLSLRDFQQQTVFHGGINFKRVAESHLFFRQTGAQGQRLIDKLRSEHGMSGFDGVGSGEVIILSSIDDYAGRGVDHARKVLVS